MLRIVRHAAGALALAAVSACGRGSDQAARDTAAAGVAGTDSARRGASAAASSAACAPNNDGLTLPSGFCAIIFADSVGHARHVAVAPNGDVYVNTWSGPYYGGSTVHEGGFVVAMRDTNRDGRADVVARFGPAASAGGKGGTGIALHAGHLYAEEGPTIVRYALASGELAPSGRSETIVAGFPTAGDHPQHNFVIDSAGTLYANMGSATNACQAKNRVAASPGRTPCTELATRAGIWRFDAARTGQRFSPAARYATGIRNAVGLAFDPAGALFATQHGRDQLAENWPKLYDAARGQELPSEELVRVEENADFGWPMCYYDGTQKKLVLAPEYRGDGGQAVGPCGEKRAPVAVFPAHWAPNALLFYTGSQFPARYRNGAFIAFHGSWNRAPGPQGGYAVAFVPRSAGGEFAAHEIFADGFAGAAKQPDAAAHRPSGLAQGPDGALYVTDDKAGRVWRIVYTGR